MNNNIQDIYNSLQEITWYFGNHGIDGECCGDLSLVEFMALKQVYENKNISIQEIGTALNFTKSGATRIIDRLENKGYALRERSPIDGRICCVQLTIKGTETVSAIMENYIIHLERMLKDLDPEMVSQVKNALEILFVSIRRQRFI